MSVAIVLAGGLGSRLKSITHDIIPKPMVQVQGKPFLHWVFRYLKQQGIKEIVIAVSHHAETISEYFRNSFEGIPLKYSIESVPLGTGGGIKQALRMVSDDAAFIINGDTYFPVDLKKMKSFHQENNCALTIALKRLHQFDRYGAITLNTDQEIIAFHEKKWVDTGYINGGIYLLNKKIMHSFKNGIPFSIEKDVFEKKQSSLKMGGFKSKARFIDIGIPEEYHRIQTFHLK